MCIGKEKKPQWNYVYVQVIASELLAINSINFVSNGKEEMIITITSQKRNLCSFSESLLKKK